MKQIKKLTGNAGDFSGIVLKAAARGDLKAVKSYLKQNPDWLNQEGPHGRTMLWEAVYKKRIEMVRYLIKQGANTNPQGSYYTPMLVELSALAVARDQQCSELMDLLQQNGATDDLYAACYRGDLEAVNHFLENDETAVNRPSRDEPFHPRMGFLPIHYAVVGGHLGVVRLLAGYGGKITEEELPLLKEWANHKRKMVSVLKSMVNVGNSPSEVKTNPEGKKAKAESAKKVPAIDRADWMGFPLLVDACRGNHNAPDDPNRVKALLKKGANINVRDHKGKTPLHRACQAGFEKITHLLIDNGAEPEAEDFKGCTPIFDAAQHGRVVTLKIMIDLKVDLGHTESRGETVLFAAARGGHPEAFQLLLDSGCDPFHLNKRGKTISNILKSSRSLTDGRQEILMTLGRLAAKRNQTKVS